MAKFKYRTVKYSESDLFSDSFDKKLKFSWKRKRFTPVGYCDKMHAVYSSKNFTLR